MSPSHGSDPSVGASSSIVSASRSDSLRWQLSPGVPCGDMRTSTTRTTRAVERLGTSLLFRPNGYGSMKEPSTPHELRQVFTPHVLSSVQKRRKTNQHPSLIESSSDTRHPPAADPTPDTAVLRRPPSVRPDTFFASRI